MRGPRAAKDLRIGGTDSGASAGGCIGPHSEGLGTKRPGHALAASRPRSSWRTTNPTGMESAWIQSRSSLCLGSGGNSDTSVSGSDLPVVGLFGVVRHQVEQQVVLSRVGVGRAVEIGVAVGAGGLRPEVLWVPQLGSSETVRLYVVSGLALRSFTVKWTLPGWASARICRRPAICLRPPRSDQQSPDECRKECTTPELHVSF